MPSWASAEQMGGCNLILSDDLDSLFSCIVLDQLFGCKIEGFYDFKAINFKEEFLKNGSENTNLIGVDIDFANNMKCFGNHVTQISTNDIRSNTANLNVINNVSARNYTDKFSGNTLMQILSLYNVDVEKWTDEQKLVLSCIDSFFLPFTTKYARFKSTQENYLKQLEQEHLGEFIVYYMDKYGEDIFKRIIDKYKLKGKINLDFGTLNTNIDLEGLSKLFNVPFLLPKNEFKPYKQYNTRYMDINNIKSSKDIVDKTNAKKIISLAVTFRNSISYTYK
ncbi:hypothetical protein CLCY_2c02660 [Clostridium cylindrosporum DSM 605]|uniref:Uncharacterized protein n=2 Tax=Clostridium cylindrosporum TaxID=1495 RepID=A0A0J8D5Y4_CLOCY|nr:hypothetical protein CLCY_2c02660 [Clostridium cylindrosporum DSM 605]